MQTIIKSKSERQNIALLVLILFGFLTFGFNLQMPFSSQAPEGDWGEPWYNDCEEVSMVMVDSFYNNRILTPVIAKQEILKMIDLKENAYGFSLDENADKIVDIINNLLNWSARAVENPTIDQIKNEIDDGHPVILPADGRMLDNRYYTSTEYHVFVISGYDDDKKMFIVQDGGTRHGHDYQYSYSIVMNAMHDYNSTDVSLGRRVAIFTNPGKKEPEKTVEPKVSISPSPTPIISDPLDEKIKKNDTPVAPEKNIEDRGIINAIKNYWNRLFEWIKNIF